MLFNTQRKIVLGTDQEDVRPLLGYFNFERLRQNHSKGRERAFAFARCGILLLAFLAAFCGGFYWPKNMEKLCTTTTSVYSPLMEDMNPAYHDARFNASIHSPTLYGQEPSTRVDEAWLELGAGWRAVQIPKDLGDRAGLKGKVQLSKESGGGYMASVEVIHQLHCLDLLRKASHVNFEYYKNLGEAMFVDNEVYMLRTHIGHCVDVLRQQLMCSADMGLVGYNWIKNMDNPVPDFNMIHRCRDFDAVRAWNMGHEISFLSPNTLERHVDDQIFDHVP